MKFRLSIAKGFHHKFAMTHILYINSLISHHKVKTIVRTLYIRRELGELIITILKYLNIFEIIKKKTHSAREGNPSFHARKFF